MNSLETSKKHLSNQKDKKEESILPDVEVVFELPELNGDQQIFLGQSIIALIGINQNQSYGHKQNQQFLVELFSSILCHLKITPEEVFEQYINLGWCE